MIPIGSLCVTVIPPDPLGPPLGSFCTVVGHEKDIRFQSTYNELDLKGPDGRPWMCVDNALRIIRPPKSSTPVTNPKELETV